MTVDVKALQTRLEHARRDRDRAQGAYESAQRLADNARADLKQEFGVSTVEEAERLLTELRETLAGQIQQLTAILDEIGA